MAQSASITEIRDGRHLTNKKITSRSQNHGKCKQTRKPRLLVFQADHKRKGISKLHMFTFVGMSEWLEYAYYMYLYIYGSGAVFPCRAEEVHSTA